MGNVDAVVENGGFAEYNIFRTYLVTLFGIFSSLEPHEVGNAGTIGEVSHDTLLSWSHLEGLETQDMSHDLYERHIASQFVDGIDPGTIDMFVRIVLKQVAIGVDTKFFTQYLLPVRSHPRQVLYVLIENVHSYINTSAIFRS